MKYLAKEEQYLKDTFNGTNFDELEKALGRSRASIIAKLSSLGLYQAEKRLVETKAQIVHDIELITGSLTGLEKTPKQTLLKLRSYIRTVG